MSYGSKSQTQNVLYDEDDASPGLIASHLIDHVHICRCGIFCIILQLAFPIYREALGCILYSSVLLFTADFAEVNFY